MERSWFHQRVVNLPSLYQSRYAIFSNQLTSPRLNDRCYTHRDTSPNDTLNAIDSWTDKSSIPFLKPYKKKLTEYRLTVVEIRGSFSQKFNQSIAKKKKGIKLKHSLNMLINPNPRFSKSPKWKGFVGSYRKCCGTGINPKSFGDGILKLASFDWGCSFSTSPFDVLGSAIVGDNAGVVMMVRKNEISNE